MSADVNVTEKEDNMSDPVNKPHHYSAGMPDGIEVIDIIRAQEADYFHGNVLKYILRWKYKNGLEDLEKAYVYLGWLIDQERAKAGPDIWAVEAPENPQPGDEVTFIPFQVTKVDQVPPYLWDKE